MIETTEQPEVGVIAVYPNRESVALALHRLRSDGFNMHDVSVIGKGFDATEVSAGAATTDDLAEPSAEAGAVAGLLIGLLNGTAFLIVPGLGPVFVAGSFAAALAGAAEGALVGAVIGGLGGALVGWGLPAAHVQMYERHVSEGKFLVLVCTHLEGVEYLRSVLVPGALDQPAVMRLNK